MLHSVSIVRLEESEQYGTFGSILVDAKILGNSLELPWRNNRSDVSCIPPGQYTLKLRDNWGGSDKWGPTYQVIDAPPPRTGILVHPANYDDQLLGCIALGRRIGVLKVKDHNERAVLNSGNTFKEFMDLLEGEEIVPLTIIHLMTGR